MHRNSLKALARGTWFFALSGLVISTTSGCFLFKKEKKEVVNQSEVREINASGINSEILFDINDINIMFTRDNNFNFTREESTGKPLPNTPPIYPDIPVTTQIFGQKNWPEAQGVPNSEGSIWDKKLFDEVIRLARDPVTTIPPRKGDDSGKIAIDFSESFGTAIDRWRIVSFRFIPCVLTTKVIESGEASIPTPGCVAQIRLIGQPFDEFDFEDFAVHLVYSFDVFPTRAQANALLTNLNSQIQNSSTPAELVTALKQQVGIISALSEKALDSRLEVARAVSAHPQIGRMITDLQNIKLLTQTVISTNGVPMGPHPGLVAEQKAGKTSAQPGPIAQAITGFLTQHLSSFHLSNISFMGLDDTGPEPWVFFGGDMGLDASGPATPTFLQTALGRKWIPSKDLTYRLKGVFPSEKDRQDKVESLSFSVQKDFIIPAPKPPSHAVSLFSPDVKNPQPAHILDNPHMTNNFNADCVSCHIGATRINNIVDPETGGLNVKANDPNRIKTVSGISGYVDPKFLSRSIWNLRNFGFMSDPDDRSNLVIPKISFRVLNESIDSTEFTNQIVFASSSPNSDLKKVQHPGMICPDDNAVWRCVVDNPARCRSVCPELENVSCFSSCKVAQTNQPGANPNFEPSPIAEKESKKELNETEKGNDAKPASKCTLKVDTPVVGSDLKPIFQSLKGVTLDLDAKGNPPANRVAAAIQIVVPDFLLTCDPKNTCRAFPEPSTTVDQQKALLELRSNKNGEPGVVIGRAKNGSFLGTLSLSADKKNRTGIIRGFVDPKNCN